MRQTTRPARNPRPRRRSPGAAAAIAVTLAILAAFPDAAAARASRVASYRYERVWPAALRFLRIDEGFTILERDAEAGYVLFEVGSGESAHRGSLELVRVKDYAERDSVKLIIKIQDRPVWAEDGVLERFLQKLRAELGQPEDPPEKKEPAPPAEKKTKKKTKDGGEA